MNFTPDVINKIKRLREQRTTIGDIADIIDWPQDKSLKSLQRIVERISSQARKI